MKQYVKKEETPLKFHKFFWYVSLPLGLLALLGNLIETVALGRVLTWVFVIDIVYYALELVLMVVCFIGFFGWKPCAWYGVMSYLSINVAYKLYAVAVCVRYIPNQTAAAAGTLLGTLIYTVLVMIYYWKRRPLFFPCSTGDAADECWSAADTIIPGDSDPGDFTP